MTTPESPEGFAGALQGKRVEKGRFITAFLVLFSKRPVKLISGVFARYSIENKVILIDGKQLGGNS